MNYIKEISGFYSWLETNELSHSAVNLWHALIHLNNKASKTNKWAKEFTAAISTLQVKTSLSKSSIIRARKELKGAGRISFRERGGNQCAEYSLLSFQIDTQSETQNAPQIETQNNTAFQIETQNGTQTETQLVPAFQIGTQSETQSATINKPEHKPKSDDDGPPPPPAVAFYGSHFEKMDVADCAKRYFDGNQYGGKRDLLMQQMGLKPNVPGDVTKLKYCAIAFNADVVHQDKASKTMTDYCTHFYRWMRKCTVEYKKTVNEIAEEGKKIASGKPLVESKKENHNVKHSKNEERLQEAREAYNKGLDRRDVTAAGD